MYEDNIFINYVGNASVALCEIKCSRTGSLNLRRREASMGNNSACYKSIEQWTASNSVVVQWSYTCMR